MATLRGLLLNIRAQGVTESLSVTLFEAVVAPVSSEKHGFPPVFDHFHQFESATSSLSQGATDPTNDPLWRPTALSVTPYQLFRAPCGYPGASPGRLWVRLFSAPDPWGCGGNVGFYSIRRVRGAWKCPRLNILMPAEQSGSDGEHIWLPFGVSC